MLSNLFECLLGSRKTSSKKGYRRPLLSPDGDTQLMIPNDKHVCVCDRCGDVVQKVDTHGRGASIQWLVAICLLCTIANCLLTADTSSSKPSFSIPRIRKGQYDTLKRPSPFIGLDKIQRPNPPEPRSILNYPHVIAQIDAEHPNYVFDDDPRRYMSHTGYVSPEDRRVKISPSISTVVQFRAIDFGMEECQLNLIIPPPAALSNSSGTPFLLSIHRLDKTSPVNTKSLAFSNSPRRIATVANLELAPDSALSWRESFHCAWDDILTFEIGCSDQHGFENDACSLEWWQTKEEDKPNHGIFMVQHSTV